MAHRHVPTQVHTDADILKFGHPAVAVKAEKLEDSEARAIEKARVKVVFDER